MKKFWLLLAAIFAVFTLSANEADPAEAETAETQETAEAPDTAADEAEIRQIYPAIQRCLREFNAAGVLEFITADYVNTDADGNETTFADFSDALEQVASMGQVLSVSNVPDASLLALFSAIFELDPTQLDAETIAMINNMADTEAGRKLADEYRQALQNMLQIYQKDIDDSLQSFSIVSIVINGDSATMIYYIRSDDRDQQVRAELVKTDGKWRVRKQIANYRDSAQ